MRKGKSFLAQFQIKCFEIRIKTVDEIKDLYPDIPISRLESVKDLAGKTVTARGESEDFYMAEGWYISKDLCEKIIKPSDKIDKKKFQVWIDECPPDVDNLYYLLKNKVNNGDFDCE